MAIPVACTMAAPTPCAALNPMSAAMLVEEPVRPALTVNMMNPRTYIRLRPSMSASRPMGSRSEPMVSMYASVTHCTVGMLASK